MINQHEICMYLEDALPEYKEELSGSKKHNPYTSMYALLKLTSRKASEYNYQVEKQCFDIAEKLYSKGNNVVKNAVENVCVYSFSTIFQLGLAEKKQLLAIIPIGLYTKYINQLHQSGC